MHTAVNRIQLFWVALFILIQEAHVYKTLADPKYSRLAGLSDMDVFKDQILKPMLIERVADTDGNMYTQEVMQLSSSTDV